MTTCLMQPRFFPIKKIKVSIKKTKVKKSLIALSLIFFSVFNITNCYAAVSVGDSYGGGTVFCVSQTPDIKQCVTQGSGNYGLIMANEDQVNFDSNPEHGVTWASKNDAIPAARSGDDGAANTAAIIAAHPKDSPSNNAAWLSHNYRDQEGHADWYLPSRNELNRMYLFAQANNLIGKGCGGSRAGGVQCLIGGYNDVYKVYWSSTEYSDFNNYAWSQDFSGGGQNDDYYKFFNYFGVRAVRAFNHSSIQQFNHLLLKDLPIAEASGVMDGNPAASPQSSAANNVLLTCGFIPEDVTEEAMNEKEITYLGDGKYLVVFLTHKGKLPEKLNFTMVNRIGLIEPSSMPVEIAYFCQGNLCRCGVLGKFSEPQEEHLSYTISSEDEKIVFAGNTPEFEVSITPAYNGYEKILILNLKNIYNEYAKEIGISNYNSSNLSITPKGNGDSLGTSLSYMAELHPRCSADEKSNHADILITYRIHKTVKQATIKSVPLPCEAYVMDYVYGTYHVGHTWLKKAGSVYKELSAAGTAIYGGYKLMRYLGRCAGQRPAPQYGAL